MKVAVRPTAVTMPTEYETESTTKKAARKTKNAFQQLLGCFQKSDHLTKIKYKEHTITKRKKDFGVEYISLVQKNASEQELRQAIDSCLQDINRLMCEISELENKVEEVNVDTRSKIRREPSISTPTIEEIDA